MHEFEGPHRATDAEAVKDRRCGLRKATTGRDAHGMESPLPKAGRLIRHPSMDRACVDGVALLERLIPAPLWMASTGMPGIPAPGTVPPGPLQRLEPRAEFPMEE